MQTQSLLADRTHRMSVNAIREILKVGTQPGMISLAGGIPAPESFPLDIIRNRYSQEKTGCVICPDAIFDTYHFGWRSKKGRSQHCGDIGFVPVSQHSESDSGSKHQGCGQGMPPQKDDNTRQVGTGDDLNKNVDSYFSLHFI